MGRCILVLLMLCGVVLYKVQGQRYDPHADCPNTCQCGYAERVPVGRGWRVSNGAYIHNCMDDIYTGLIHISQTYPTIDGLQLSNVTHTAAEAGNMTRLLSVITKFPSLRVLSLRYNNLTQLPNTILSVSALRLLDVSNNMLTILPDTISSMDRLQVLDVSNNMLTILPDTIGSMVSLGVLDVSNNMLTILPDTIGSMVSLWVLDVSNNMLMTLPWQDLRSAQFVNAAHNNIICIDMIALVSKPHRWVDLSHNSIKSLGAVPTTEPNFGHLDLSSNMLTSLDVWYFRLGVVAPSTQYDGSLRYDKRMLNVSGNAIFNITNDNNYQSLPPNNNSTKWTVDLKNNKIEYLHTMSENLNTTEDELLYFITSEHINLKNNPLNCDCEDFDMYRALKLETPPPALTCAAPVNIQRRHIAEVELDQFMCIVTMGCPTRCHCTDTPYNKSLNVICEGYEESHPPQHVPMLGNKGYGYHLDFDGGSLENLTYRSYMLDTVSASFRYNNISYISPDFFNGSNFRFIDLRNNQLRVVGTWALRLVLQQPESQIYLDHNSISAFIDDNAYNPDQDYSKFYHNPRDHIVLSLVSNNISHFSDLATPWNMTIEFIEDLIEEDFLDLGNNPFFCDCQDIEFYSLIHYKPNMTCAGPVELEGRALSNISLDQFKCEVFAGCPDGCVCFDIPMGYSDRHGLLTVECQNYTDTKLPMHLPSPNTNASEYLYSLTFENGHLTHLERRDYLRQVIKASFRNNEINTVDPGFLLSLKTADVLRLDNNHLTWIPISHLNRPNLELYLGHNDWKCSCENAAIVHWFVDNAYEVTDYANATCQSPGSFHDRSFFNVTGHLCSADQKPKTQIVEKYKLDVPPIVLCVLFALSLFIIGLAYVKRVWLHKKFKVRPFRRDGVNDVDKEFDIFISYCESDSRYIEGTLLPWLEDNSFKVCHHRINFLAGESIIWNINKAIAKSKQTLVFFSYEYMKSGTCMYEFYTALSVQVMEKTNHLVTIKDKRIDIKTLETGIRSFFRLYTYIEEESPQFWDNLLYVLPAERMNAQANIDENDAVRDANDILMNIAALGDDE